MNPPIAQGAELADSPKRERLVAEITLLRRQQIDCIENATFFGWTTEAKADHERRADRLEVLVHRLAKLDMTP